MNTIVENKSKLDELVQEGYKIIYPNSIDGLDFVITIKKRPDYGKDMDISALKKSYECSELKLLEKFKYRNSLFVVPYDYCNKTVTFYSLSFDKGKAIKVFDLKSIYFVSDETEKQKRELKYLHKVNYILFNPNENALIFYLDDEFKTFEQKKKLELSNDLKTLFD